MGEPRNEVMIRGDGIMKEILRKNKIGRIIILIVILVLFVVAWDTNFFENLLGWWCYPAAARLQYFSTAVILALLLSRRKDK